MPAITVSNTLLVDGTISLEKPTFFINCEFRHVIVMSPNFTNVIFQRCIFRDGCDVSGFPAKNFQECEFLNSEPPF